MYLINDNGNDVAVTKFTSHTVAHAENDCLHFFLKIIFKVYAVRLPRRVAACAHDDSNNSNNNRKLFILRKCFQWDFGD